MKTITKTYIVYKANELSIEAHAKALNNFIQSDAFAEDLRDELLYMYSYALSNDSSFSDVPLLKGVRIDPCEIGLDYSCYADSTGYVSLYSDSNRRGASIYTAKAIHIDDSFIRDCLEIAKPYIVNDLKTKGYYDTMRETYDSIDEMLDSVCASAQMESNTPWFYKDNNVLMSVYLYYPDDMPPAMFEDIFDYAEFIEYLETIAEERILEYLHAADKYVETQFDIHWYAMESFSTFCEGNDLYFTADGNIIDIAE